MKVGGVVVMKSKLEIVEMLRNDFSYLKSEYHVRTMGLFGSYAREEQTEDSDVDLLVEFSETPNLSRLVGLNKHLEKQLGVHVDTVTPGAINPRLRDYIMEDLEFIE